MVFDLETVKTACSKVRLTATKGKDVETYGMFCFRAGKVSTFDGISGTITSCDLGGLEFLVNADKFWAILDKLTDPRFEIHQVEGWLQLQSGRFTAKVPTLPVYDFPEIMPKNPQIYCSASNLVEALKDVSFTVEKDESKQIAGVGFRGHYVYSLDGKRITRAHLHADVTEPRVISKRAADLIVRMGTPTYLFSTPTSVGALFKETKTIFISRIRTSGMPFDFIDKAFDTKMVTAVPVPKELVTVLERVMVQADKDESRLTFSCDGKTLTIATKDQETGMAQDSLPLDLGRSFKVYVKAQSLSQALKRMKPDFIDFTDITHGDKRMLKFMKNGCEHSLALMCG